MCLVDICFFVSSLDAVMNEFLLQNILPSNWLIFVLRLSLRREAAWLSLRREAAWVLFCCSSIGILLDASSGEGYESRGFNAAHKYVLRNDENGWIDGLL